MKKIKRMKIMIVSNNFIGLYSFRKELIKAIREEDHEIVISAPFDEMKDYFKENGCHLVNTQFNRKGMNPIKDFALILNYIKLIKRVKPDVVLSYTIKPNLYGGMACQLCHVPQIVNVTGLGSAVETPGWLQRLTILLYKVGLRKTNTVFFQNRANMEFCESHGMVNSKKILIPGSGVNLKHHSLQAYPEDGTIRFVFISRLIKEKGIEEYFGAAKIIKSRYPSAEFHVVGWCEDAYSEQLKELQDDGIIKYHGPVSDVRPLIGMAHCTIHPSFYPEGMSNVLLESCAAGRPIITTNRPGCGEIVEDGRTGYLVKEKDVCDLVAVIERFLNLPYKEKEKMGLKARNKVENEFDRQIVVDAYLKEIEDIRRRGK